MSTEQESQLLFYITQNGIISPNEVPNFMAQVGHKFSEITHLEESLRYSSDDAFKRMEKGSRPFFVKARRPRSLRVRKR
jgi:predicted chitinase